MATKSRTKAYIYLLLVAAIWGAAGPVVKFTLDGLTPYSFLAYRFFLSGLFALLFTKIKGVKMPSGNGHLFPIITYGILAFSLALSFLFVGLEKSTVLDLTLLGAAGPLVVTAGGYFFFRDRITNREKLGIAIVLLGVIIDSILPFFLHTETEVRFTGNIFLMLFLLTDSAAVLWSKHLVKKDISSVTITMIGFVVAALTIIPFAYYMEGDIIVTSLLTLPFKYHLGVWYMAFASGILAYFLAIQAGKSIEISEAWLFMYLQPLFSVPLAVFWLEETITTTFIIGAAIIATGVFIAEKK